MIISGSQRVNHNFFVIARYLPVRFPRQMRYTHKGSVEISYETSLRNLSLTNAQTMYSFACRVLHKYPCRRIVTSAGQRERSGEIN